MKTLHVALLVWSMTATALFSSITPRERCMARVPDTLNVGVRSSAVRNLRQELPYHLRNVFSLIPRPRDPGCEEGRPLQINIATGTDYQLLDWMSQGLLDAAVLPDLSVSLLARDGISAYEVVNLDARDADALLPSARPEPHAGRFSEGFRQPLPNPVQEYDTFLAEVWSRAIAAHDAPAKNGGAAPVRSRHVIFASHLSSTGFVWPVTRASAVFNQYLDRAGRRNDAPLTDALWNELFASVRFSLDCADVEECFDSAVSQHERADFTEHGWSGHEIVILFPGEDALGAQKPEEGEDAFRPHLIVSAVAAMRVFKVPDHHLRPPQPRTPGVFTAMIDASRRGRQQVPSALRAVFVPEPLFGVRTYGFTMDEALRLLKSEQRNSADSHLALVLPGGGVKAAYQTRIIDELYEHAYLENQAVEQSDASSNALRVRTVIGTSGGALLGYFVSQLGKNPVELFDVLWMKDGQMLKSTDIFGWTDLLRYVSIVVTFAVFCVLLFFTSAPKGAEPAGHVYRWRLTLAVIPLFVLAPVFIRWVSPSEVEHVPEIEGIFYAVMAIMVMIADQLLIYRKDAAAEPGPRLRKGDLVLIAAGVVLLSMSLFGPAQQRDLGFGIAFATMLLVVVGGTIVLIKAQQGTIERPVRRAVEIVSSVVVVLALCSAGWILREMHIFAGVALLLVAALQYAYIQARPQIDFQWILTFVAVFLVAELCWPREPIGRGWLALMQSPSLQISTAAFFLALGFIILLIGGSIWTYRSRAYELDRGKDGLVAAVVVVIAYVLLTLLIMAALTTFASEWVTPLELTPRFWLAVLIVSAAIGIAIIVASRHERLKATRFAKGVSFLCEQHPNGTIVQRRYARMLLFAASAVAWWNIVEAPALYGNRHAREYHANAIRQFNLKRCNGRKPCGDFNPTARFVAPANLLQQDGTRYFMFLPPNEPDCPAVPNRPASGAQWLIFRGDHTSAEGCDPKPSEDDIKEVTFASGSPFPIFPAHVLNLARESSGDETAFVDGGYSNNVPVDAARTLGASQVLIIQSSSALPAEITPSRITQWIRAHVFGKLVRNAERLPDYLFERSQQVDRLSSRDMFVVSLSPSRDEADWPALFDFRASVVRRMRDTATASLKKRIGLVQSWGLPQFSLHTDLITNAPPATSGGR